MVGLRHKDQTRKVEDKMKKLLNMQVSLIMALMLLTAALSGCQLLEKKEASLETAEDLLDDGKIDEAVDMLEELIDDDEEDHELWQALVEAYMEDEAFDDAADVMEDWAKVIEDMYEDDPEDVADAIEAYEDLKEDIIDEDEDLEVYVLDIGTGDDEPETPAVTDNPEEPVAPDQPDNPAVGIEQGINIPDMGLKEAILNALTYYGYEDVEIITEAMALEVEEIYAYNSGIEDLTGIEFFENLVYLDLDSNAIVDIRPLSGLIALEELVLWDNLVEDITPLRSLRNLVRLDLEDNLIFDISVLADLDNVETLYVSGNPIMDYAPLEDMDSLAFCDVDDLIYDTEGDIKVGLITDGNSVDVAFNQLAWNGLVEYYSYDIGIQYIIPDGWYESSLIDGIEELISDGCEIVVLPGFMFEVPLFEVQDLYPDVKFILLDGTPHSADYSDFDISDNAVSVFFKEQEAAFLAGVVAALETRTGELGFIGGMAIPTVQRFAWGFVAGVEYANEVYGANARIDRSNFIYQGSFSDIEAGEALAADMYDSGVDIIFCAAGGVGIGAINEAKDRASDGDYVKIVGVDVDQYDDGIYDGYNSVVITSAVKKLDVALAYVLDEIFYGTFPGGREIVLGVEEGCVGVPYNPDTSIDTDDAVWETEQMIYYGDITIPTTERELEDFLGFDFINDGWQD